MENDIYYCAKCRSYVTEEDKSCPVCGTQFSDLVLMDSSDFTEIMSFSNDFEAEIVKAKLSEAGIESVIFRDTIGELYPSLNNSLGIKLFVHQNDAAKAKELLDSESGLEDDITDDDSGN